MRYLNSSELAQFHAGLLDMCEKHARSKRDESWGYPSGVIYCDTYTFDSKYGKIYLGHEDFDREQRWWIAIGLEEQQSGTDLSIAFEMNIPKTDNRYVSVHYAIDDTNNIHILHKGKFTIGHGSASMSDFFDHYKSHPAGWPTVRHNFQDYLQLGTTRLTITDAEFASLLLSLADFANYIPDFKAKYRGGK